MEFIYITKWILMALCVVLAIRNYRAIKREPENYAETKFIILETWVLLLVIFEMIGKISIAIAV